jgi:hypothetical protein
MAKTAAADTRIGELERKVLLLLSQQEESSKTISELRQALSCTGDHRFSASFDVTPTREAFCRMPLFKGLITQLYVDRDPACYSLPTRIGFDSVATYRDPISWVALVILLKLSKADFQLAAGVPGQAVKHFRDMLRLRHQEASDTEVELLTRAFQQVGLNTVLQLAGVTIDKIDEGIAERAVAAVITDCRAAALTIQGLILRTLSSHNEQAGARVSCIVNTVGYRLTADELQKFSLEQSAKAVWKAPLENPPAAAPPVPSVSAPANTAPAAPEVPGTMFYCYACKTHVPGKRSVHNHAVHPRSKRSR